MSTTQEKTEADKTVRADLRGRVALGSVAASKDFAVRFGNDGEIILVPIVPIPDREAWFWKNANYAAAAQRGLADAAAGRVREVAAAQYADIEID